MHAYQSVCVCRCRLKGGPCRRGAGGDRSESNHTQTCSECQDGAERRWPTLICRFSPRLLHPPFFFQATSYLLPDAPAAPAAAPSDSRTQPWISPRPEICRVRPALIYMQLDGQKQTAVSSGSSREQIAASAGRQP